MTGSRPSHRERSPAPATPVCADDHPASFAAIRGQLTNRRGVRLVDYLAQLTPHYWRIYLDLAVGGAALAGSVAGIAAGQTAGISALLLVPLGATLIGFWYFYLVSFIHEGVHWNLASNPTVNDLLCNVLASCMIATHLGSWRQHHFEHHRSLGTVHDTEVTYFLPLNVVAMLKSLAGMRAVEALLSYLRRMNDARKPGTSVIDPRLCVGVIAAATAHGMVVVGLWALGWTAASVAWLLGVGGVMPLFNTIRQVLEHRAADASAHVDYFRTDHGAHTRMFGTGWFDTVFGSAGANRHLLHHWEPQVSYTRLADLERFLGDTAVRDVIDRHRTTYVRSFRDLFSV